MLHDPRAYLSDIIEACIAIEAATEDLDIDAYKASRLVRSSVEREFIIIGEAVAALFRVLPDIAEQLTDARRIVDFRNQLTHEYLSVDHEIVWAIAKRDAPILLRECELCLNNLE